MAVVIILALLSLFNFAHGNKCLLNDVGIYPSLTGNHSLKIFYFHPAGEESAYFRLFCKDEFNPVKGFQSEVSEFHILFGAESLCVTIGGLEEGCPEEYNEITTTTSK